MTVSISAEASADLEAIADFIALDNPIRAVSFVNEIVEACHTLAAQPRRHPIRSGFSREVRRFPYQGYSIYYEIRSEDAVVIVHVLSDALDHRRYFGSH